MNLKNLAKSRPSLECLKLICRKPRVQQYREIVPFKFYIKIVAARVQENTEKRTALQSSHLFAPIVIPCTASMSRINIQEYVLKKLNPFLRSCLDKFFTLVYNLLLCIQAEGLNMVGLRNQSLSSLIEAYLCRRRAIFGTAFR